MASVLHKLSSYSMSINPADMGAGLSRLIYSDLLTNCMGLIDSGGFSLPMAVQVEVVEATLDATESAKEAMIGAMGSDTETHVLMVSVEAGGCSGHMYDMQIIERPNDLAAFQSFQFGDITLLIHNKDSTLLNGIRIDYRDTLLGGGFQIENPNADKSCGCGQSFS
ncbi:MAG: iron-sulfur cluster assembly accessory protein [Candidatus Poseidoniales archaeon]|nr:MAG: iron-sulfur cluster assembly accessory protein [Candidatus Poseidoniales archaeon]